MHFSGDVRVITTLLTRSTPPHLPWATRLACWTCTTSSWRRRPSARRWRRGSGLDDVVPDAAGDAGGWGVVVDAVRRRVPVAATAAAEPAIAAEEGLFAELGRFPRHRAGGGLRRAAHRADKPRRGRLGTDEDVAALVPPADLKVRLKMLPQSYRRERGIDTALTLALTREAGERSLVEARQASGSTLLWPDAHYLGPLHPVLDWAADRALAQMDRGEAPVVGADVDAPTAIMLGTLANHRGQIVLRSLVALEFGPAGTEPLVTDDVPDLLRRAGLHGDGTNPGAHGVGDLDAAQALVPRAVAAMQTYMATQKALRRDAMTDPVRAAGRRVRQWRAEVTALAERSSAVEARRLRENAVRFGTQANELAASLSARDDANVQVLLMIVPRGGA